MRSIQILMLRYLKSVDELLVERLRHPRNPTGAEIVLRLAHYPESILGRSQRIAGHRVGRL
jgi:hypothetical protein